MSKNDPKLSKLDKYDVEANIEEIDNSEDYSVFKYGITALSDPKNVRLSIEGTAKILGDSMERDEILVKDENDVPKILTLIYHELFPTFFLLSKTLNVSCPPHTIGEMGSSLQEDMEERGEETEVESEEISESAEEKIDDVSGPEETVAQPTV